jgi:hypothetical protein
MFASGFREESLTNSLFHLCARHFTRNDSNLPISNSSVFCLHVHGNWARRVQVSSLSVTSKSSGVWSSLLSASHITALLCLALLQSSLLILSSLTRAQEQRRDTTSSSFDGRTPRASPSRTRGLGSPPPTLQLFEFEEPCLYPSTPTHASGVWRQRSHAS